MRRSIELRRHPTRPVLLLIEGESVTPYAGAKADLLAALERIEEREDDLYIMDKWVGLSRSDLVDALTAR